LENNKSTVGTSDPFGKSKGLQDLYFFNDFSNSSSVLGSSFKYSVLTLSKASANSERLTGASNDFTINTAIGFSSMFIPSLPVISASITVTPLPPKGSSTKSPGLLKFLIYAATTFHDCFVKYP